MSGDDVSVAVSVNDGSSDQMGCIDEKAEKVDKETGESECEKVGGLGENGDSIRCAIKFDTVSVGKIGNGCGTEMAFAELSEIIDHTIVEKQENTNVEKQENTNVEKQEREGGKEKRQRRRGNSRKKLDAQNSFKGKEDCVVTEAQTRVKRYGDEAKITYSREEMEALRFVDLEAQNKKWVEVYCGLAPAALKDYDDLANCNQQKQTQLDFDPRKQFENMERNPGVHGEDSYHFMDNETGNVNPSDLDSNCSEEDDSDDDCTSILRPAFFVSGEPKFDSGPPQDGFEYLRRVRWEAERIPKVKVVKLEKSKLIKEQTVYMPNIPDIAKCPEHILPLKEWEDTFLADFSKLRLAFSRVDSSNASSSSIVKLPSSVDKEESSPQIPGNLVEEISNIISNKVESCCDGELLSIVDENTDNACVTGSSKESPILSLILNMDSVARLLMLRRRITSVSNVTSLSKNDCMWLFALCVAIDTPLDGDTCASLRCLLRKSASLRAGKIQMDDECIMLNIIATIADIANEKLKAGKEATFGKKKTVESPPPFSVPD